MSSLGSRFSSCTVYSVTCRQMYKGFPLRSYQSLFLETANLKLRPERDRDDLKEREVHSNVLRLNRNLKCQG